MNPKFYFALGVGELFMSGSLVDAVGYGKSDWTALVIAGIFAVLAFVNLERWADKRKA